MLLPTVIPRNPLPGVQHAKSFVWILSLLNAYRGKSMGYKALHDLAHTALKLISYHAIHCPSDTGLHFLPWICRTHVLLIALDLAFEGFPLTLQMVGLTSLLGFSVTTSESSPEFLHYSLIASLNLLLL